MLDYVAAMMFAVPVIAWLAIVVSSFRMVAHTKPGVRRFSRELAWNPFNVIFRGDLLTEKGIAARRHLGWATLIFVVSIVSFLLLGSIASG